MQILWDEMAIPFVSVWPFAPANSELWLNEAKTALQIVAQQSGFLDGHIVHSPDEPSRYLIEARWQDVGSYRRALSSTEMKLRVWPFLADMLNEPTVYETLYRIDLTGTNSFETSLASD